MADSFAGDFRSMEERNREFLFNATIQRYEDYKELVIKKNVNIIPPGSVNVYDEKDVQEYIKNLLLCTTENTLCYESFITLFANFFKDGFNFAMNARIISGNINKNE